MTEAVLSQAWERARGRWAQPVLLGEPVHDPKVDLAMIDLHTRRVHVNLERLAALGLEHVLEAVLAHEVGHHLRYPGDLMTSARLRLLERSLIPLEGFSCVNLFTDLLINERLGVELADVYRALKRGRRETSDVFHFYLAIYEELWQLEEGELMNDDRRRFEERHPRYRADAHLLAQDLFPLAPEIYTQFLFFLSVLVRYLAEDATSALESLACRCGDAPSSEDWARGLVLGPAERRAIARARSSGWLSPDDLDRLGDERAFERRIASLPGQGVDDAEQVPEVMAAWYRQEAERYLVRPPPQRRLGEAVVPTTLEEWDPGDPLAAIDWTATLLRLGPELGAASPLKREAMADEEGLELPRWQPRMEIYLDVSGSMPNPCLRRNAMTLAALVLATGTLRNGGWVRALVYSHEHVRFWEFSRSAIEVSRFLMHYVGGGTEFPFDVLASSLDELRHDPPIRVVISDSDFDRNVSAKEERLPILRDAAARSASLILLLHREADARSDLYTSLGARLVHVRDLEDFPETAAALSRVLFGGGSA